MEEIKICELSVGDWIATESAQLVIEGNDIATAFVDKVKKPIQIVSVLGAEQLVFGRIEEIDGFTTIYLKAEHIKPIPLTSEILEKNGFVKEEDEDGNKRYSLIEGGTKFSLGYARSVFQWTSPIDVRFVHKLQHLLRFCGLKKEIEL